MIPACWCGDVILPPNWPWRAPRSFLCDQVLRPELNALPWRAPRSFLCDQVLRPELNEELEHVLSSSKWVGESVHRHHLHLTAARRPTPRPQDTRLPSGQGFG